MAMGSDSVSNASVPAFSKDSAKNKRTNRLLKLKQSKLDVRRDHWLSHGKNKSNEVDSNAVDGGSSPPSVVRVNKADGGVLADERLKGVETKHEVPVIRGGESVSLSSRSRSVDNGGRHHHGLLSKDSITSSSNSSSSNSACSSGSTSEEERDELDDWEAVADALNIEIFQPPSPSEVVNNRRSDGCKIPNDSNSLAAGDALRGPLHNAANNRAWRPDDAFRPQSLPSITKQQFVGVVNGSLSSIVRQHARVVNSEHFCAQGGRVWSWRRRTVVPQQQPSSSCPICCEDLDVTDRSFRPCPCGFQLCLFCHKRIREDDGRCPGCRKPYEALNVGACFIARSPDIQIRVSMGRT
ncbi:hypothetical protein Dimus_033920 [Dionaea muscipula]